MNYFPAIFALFIAAVGWFYLFHSRAAAHMADVEDQRLNIRRVRLRRFNGGVLLLLAICFYAGFYTNWDQPGSAFLLLWLLVLILLLISVLLAIADVRITLRLRRRQEPRD